MYNKTLGKGSEEKKTEKVCSFAKQGGEGSRGVVKSQTSILEMHFFREHAESF